jgi:hypothetical protein
MKRTATTAAAIEDFLGCAPRMQPLSLGMTVRRVRSLAPNCELTDEELADIVASYAVGMGFSVLLFDVTEIQPYSDTPAAADSSYPNIRSVDDQGRKVIALVPELQRAAYRITGDQTSANRLVERVLTLAISSIDHRPLNQSVEDWLLGLIRNFGSPSRH